MRPEVTELFHKLADLSPEARATYLAEHPVDAGMRREVEELLAHDAPRARGLETTNALTQSIAASAAQALRQMDATGARCGAFRLMSVIGRGGMGVVYLAERVDGEVSQRAAVKLLHPGWSELHRERFLQEREILAGLTHPNIAHLLDAGRLDDGQPYFAMEYVEGKPIDQHCAGLSVREKIELFLKVCGAVEYLHRNLIVHRDLKPGNILVTGHGEPKLLDFGIAKMLDFDGERTVTQLRMLTPSYASPEQLSGGSVGTGSDIYSLGAVLHMLLTGRPPQQGGPSVQIPELKGDLELILQTALRPEPQERYASVEEFAGDLRAFLNSQGIRARQGDRAYRARKFVRRYWVPTALTGALALAAMSAGGMLWYRSRTIAPLKALTPERLTANTPELPVQAAAISPDGKSVAYSDLLGVHIRELAGGATRLVPGTSGHVLAAWTPDGAGLKTTVQDGGVEKVMVVSAYGGAPSAASGSVPWMDSPDGKLRASADGGRQALTLQAAAGGNSRVVWSAGGQTRLAEFRWNPDSSRIAVASSTADGSALEVIDVAGGKPKTLVPLERKLRIVSMAWAGASRIIVADLERVGAAGYNSNLWELRLDAAGGPVAGSLRKLTAWRDFPILAGSLTTDGRRLVFVRSFGQRDVYVAGIDAGRSRLEPPRRLTMELGDDYPTGWTRDGKAVILTSDRNGPMNIFRQELNQKTAEPMVAWPGSQLLPRVTPDGKSMLFCSIAPGQRTCRLMRCAPLAGGTPELVAEAPNIVGLRCPAVGTCSIAEQEQGSGPVVSEMDLVKGKGREIYRDPDSHAGGPDVSPDGKWLAGKPSGTKITLRAFLTGAVVREIPVRSAARLTSLDFAPDGKGFFSGDVTATETRLLYIDLSGRATVLWRQAGSFVMWAIPSPGGRNLAMLMYTIDSNVYTVDNF